MKQAVFNFGLSILERMVGLNRLAIAVRQSLSGRSNFEYEGSRLSYHFHSYNNLGFTERAVEIPIVAHWLKAARPSNVLEIGNVSNYYYDRFGSYLGTKQVVDKFEIGAGVTNCDIRQFFDPRGFDFIFSISTFEHMDSDAGRNPDYGVTVQPSPPFSSVALANISYVCDRLLRVGGTAVITFPFKYGNAEIDRSLNLGELMHLKNCSYEVHYLARLNELEWRQVSSADKLPSEAYSRFGKVNGLGVLVLRK